MFLVRFLVLLLGVWGWTATASASIDGSVALNNERKLASPISLQGTWRFFPDLWVAPESLPSMAAAAVPTKVPGSWQLDNGRRISAHYTGTYWLKMYVGAAMDTPLSLRFERLCGASAIYFFRDGEPPSSPLSYRGRLDRNAAGEVVLSSDALISLPDLRPGLYHLLVQQSNHYYRAGGLCGQVSIGTTTAQEREHTLQLTKNVVVITLLLALALGSLVLGSQNGERATPWLALVCLAICLLIATTSGIMDALAPTGSRWPQEWQYAISFFAIVWIPPALLMLYWQTFSLSLPRYVLVANLAVPILLTLALVVLPNPLLMASTKLLLGACFLHLAAGIGIVVAAIKTRRRYAWLVLLSLLPVLAAASYDFMQYYYRGVTELASPYTLALLIAVHSWIYTLKFGGAYQLAARLSAHLQEEVDLRTSELRDKNYKLEAAQSALQRANEALKQLSITDGLTQVYNRMHFEQQFEQEWRRCARQGLPLSILMIDADHFKQLNDSAGHLAGDQCLQAIAAALEQQFKRAGEMVARYGGEEFIVLLPDTNQNKALAVAEGLRLAVERLAIHHAGKQYRVTVSIGVSTTVPTVDQPAAQLLATADAALYEAKDSGRNRVHSIPLLGQRRAMAQQQLRL